MDRVKVLSEWITKEGRKQNWIALQVECSPQWLNYVLNGKKPMSDKLAHALHEKLGVPLVGKGKAAPKRTKRRSKSKQR